MEAGWAFSGAQAPADRLRAAFRIWRVVFGWVDRVTDVSAARRVRSVEPRVAKQLHREDVAELGAGQALIAIPSNRGALVVADEDKLGAGAAAVARLRELRVGTATSLRATPVPGGDAAVADISART